ncbi:hypothetical protein K9M47_00915 [Candidatus Gracilibacteria bacterium]|nr:hypothetical protein [Candidatus Gracilibacteria bacterium]
MTVTQKDYNRGYIALFSVIILGAIGLGVTVSLLLSGLSSSRTNFQLQQKSEARAVASTCAEEALQQILDTGIISGSATTTLSPDVFCTYVITSTGSQPLIQAKGVSGIATSKINVILASSTPRIKLSSWQEVVDF